MCSRTDVTKGADMVDRWKVIVSRSSSGSGNRPAKDGRRRVFSRIEALEPGAVCSDTYLVVGTFDTEEEANRMVSYLETRFVRFLVTQASPTQAFSRQSFRFVPPLPDDLEGAPDELDKQLYKMYGLDDEEINYIEATIKPPRN